ncbi:MAG: tRNA (adenosine(37)-N6)-threonylcarbamoyltransferase complex dimerization subunit type 1 TsaB [Gemmatimonadota bacterium]
MTLPAPMWIACETSGDQASVATRLPDGTIAEEVIPGSRRHARELIPALERLLTASNCTIKRVQGVLVSDGPGSFTGLRIGATVAKGLAHMRRCPLRSASALAVIARGGWRAAGGGARRVLAVTDALRGDVYAALYQIDDATMVDIMPWAVVSPAALESWPGPDLLVSTMALPILAGTQQVDGEGALPRAATLLDLFQLDGATTLVTDLETWEPDYGRPAEAQARWEAAHGRRLPDSTGTAR